MKPSERRALEAEKRAEKEAAEREKLLAAKAKRQSVNDGRENPIDDKRERRDDATYVKLPEEEIEVKGDGYHRESFFGNHVRLITFIITAALVLTVLGPWGIDMLVNKSRSEWNDVDGVTSKIEMTLNDVRSLANKGDRLKWEDLADFNYDDYSFEKEGKQTFIREYPVSGSILILRVGGSTDTGSPEYVRLINYSEGASIDDIRKEDVDVFIDAYGD